MNERERERKIALRRKIDRLQLNAFQIYEAQPVVSQKAIQ